MKISHAFSTIFFKNDLNQLPFMERYAIAKVADNSI